MCSIPELKVHIEKQWLPGMSWDNWGYGKGKWHIDHIIPRSAFNFATPSDPGFKECWSLGNLQPLWARDNIAKSDLLGDGGRARRKSVP
jgi:hypothetical protein